MAGWRHDAVPQREEHQLGRRVPHSAARALARQDQGRPVSNEIVQHHDWLPTFLAMAGEPDVIEKLKKGYQAIGRTYKNHIDGFNLLPYLTGKEKESPRKLFVYFSDDGDMLGVRYDNWKIVFMEQRCKGTMGVWAEPFVAAAPAQDLQPAHRPLRVRGHHVEHVLRVVHPPRLHPLRRDDDRSEVRGDVQGVPDGPEAEHLHASMTRSRRWKIRRAARGH